MIEKTIYEYLNEKLTVPTGLEAPKEKPEEYVIVEKEGSSLENFLCDSLIAVQSYSSSMYGAALLNEQVKTAMMDMIELDEICSVRLNSDYNDTDPDSAQYRYQAVFDITHY